MTEIRQSLDRKGVVTTLVRELRPPYQGVAAPYISIRGVPALLPRAVVRDALPFPYVGVAIPQQGGRDLLNSTNLGT